MNICLAFVLIVTACYAISMAYGSNNICGELAFPYCIGKEFGSIPTFQIPSSKRNSSKIFLTNNKITVVRCEFILISVLFRLLYLIIFIYTM